MKKRKIIFLSIIAIIFLILLFGYFILRWIPKDITEVTEINSEEHWGTITGSLGYPSDIIPDMGVCAESTDQNDLFCTYEIIENEDFTYGLGYEIKVPPDSYYVFAHLIDETNKNIGYTDEDKAYYSKFVTCGMGLECTSHKPIKVTVERYETVTRIDPIDWYNF
ncbi:MAG: hypothetical protein U5L76_04220 [Patescibacteria group bacterium]|nr:hypothetical protein [Patescibacteria group bacterium]